MKILLITSAFHLCYGKHWESMELNGLTMSELSVEATLTDASTATTVVTYQITDSDSLISNPSESVESDLDILIDNPLVYSFPPSQGLPPFNPGKLEVPNNEETSTQRPHLSTMLPLETSTSLPPSTTSISQPDPPGRPPPGSNKIEVPAPPNHPPPGSSKPEVPDPPGRPPPGSNKIEVPAPPNHPPPGSNKIEVPAPPNHPPPEVPGHPPPEVSKPEVKKPVQPHTDSHSETLTKDPHPTGVTNSSTNIEPPASTENPTPEQNSSGITTAENQNDVIGESESKNSSDTTGTNVDENNTPLIVGLTVSLIVLVIGGVIMRYRYLEAKSDDGNSSKEFDEPIPVVECKPRIINQAAASASASSPLSVLQADVTLSYLGLEEVHIVSPSSPISLSPTRDNKLQSRKRISNLTEETGRPLESLSISYINAERSRETSTLSYLSQGTTKTDSFLDSAISAETENPFKGKKYMSTCTDQQEM